MEKGSQGGREGIHEYSLSVSPTSPTLTNCTVYGVAGFLRLVPASPRTTDLSRSTKALPSDGTER